MHGGFRFLVACNRGGAVKFDQLHRLELPVMVQRKQHYALITEVGKGRVLLADPEQGWLTLPMTEARETWGEQVQVVLLKRLYHHQ